MCIKNVNATLFIFDNVERDTGGIVFRKNDSVPKANLVTATESNRSNLALNKLALLTNISIIDGIEKYLKRTSRLYVSIRLSKTIGRDSFYIDLDSFHIDFNEEQIQRKYCADFLNFNRITHISNLQIPYDDSGDDEYVFKVLVKEKEEDMWIIQSAQTFKIAPQ